MDEERKKLLGAFSDKPEVLIDFLSNDNEERKAGLEEKRAKTAHWLKEHEAINRMRQTWSRWLLACIVGIVLFDFCFLIFLGIGGLYYDSQALTFSFVGQDLVKIGGLAYIVVNFLFDKNNKE